jgi:K+-sensing histidine kinase KdpD
MLWIINLVDAEYQKEKIDINQVVKNIVKQNITQLKEEKITIKNNIKEKNIYKTLNKQHLEICLWNIIKNAIKYSNKNSIINIEYQDNEIIIQDYWVWIEKKNLKNIYDSYFRENYLTHEWYGLWLALVKKICDLNQWTINIISEKNIGTIVKIKID